MTGTEKSAFDELYIALLAVTDLERGLALAFTAISDPDQRARLLEAKASIIRARDILQGVK